MISWKIIAEPGFHKLSPQNAYEVHVAQNKLTKQELFLEIWWTTTYSKNFKLRFIRWCFAGANKIPEV